MKSRKWSKVKGQFFWPNRSVYYYLRCLRVSEMDIGTVRYGTEPTENINPPGVSARHCTKKLSNFK